MSKRWLGGAYAIKDVWTISLSGTIVSQTYTITINGKSISYTAGGSDSAAVILGALVTLWTNLQTPAPVEFSELSPVVSGSTIIATGLAPGNPTLISVATTGAATFSSTNTIPATGPNDFANALNWSGGVAPVNSDTLVFDSGNVSCKFGLGTTLTGIILITQPGYSGTIGLPQTNSNNSVSYNEYRPTNLTLAGGTVSINSPSCKMLNVAFGANTATVQVLGTASQGNSSIPIVQIIGGNSSSQLSITQGNVGLAPYIGQTADFPTILTSYQNNPKSDVSLYCGPGCTLATISKNGGKLTVNSNVTTLTQGVSGGTTIVQAGAVATAVIDNGTLTYNSVGALGACTLAGKAILDFAEDPQAKTVSSAIQIYGDNASVNDPMRVVNSGTLSVTTFQTTQINVNHGSGSVMSFS